MADSPPTTCPYCSCLLDPNRKDLRNCPRCGWLVDVDPKTGGARAPEVPRGFVVAAGLIVGGAAGWLASTYWLGLNAVATSIVGAAAGLLAALFAVPKNPESKTPAPPSDGPGGGRS